MKKRVNIWCLFFSLIICLPFSLMADLSVDFGRDTVYTCRDMSILLEPAVSGGNTPYQFSWSNGASSSTIAVSHEEEGEYTYWLEAVDADGNKLRDTVIVSVLAECVWPGDANGDRSANHFDILSIGVGFGETGPLRPDAHTNWIGQTAHPWDGHDHSGVNFVHADANGDGQVDLEDMLVVDMNYTQALPGTGGSIGSADDPSLFLKWEEATQNGDTISIPLYLGTEAIPSDSTYGLAFTLDYDPEEIPGAIIYSDTDSSWLGKEGNDLFKMDFSFPDLGTIDVVISRLDQEDRDGFGRLMDIVIIIDDLILKDEESPKPFRLNLENPRLVASTGRILSLFTEPQAIVLSGDNILEPSAKLELYPNPAQLTMTIEWNNIYLEDLYILDTKGKRYEIPMNLRNNTAVVDVTSLTSGLYTLVIREKNKAYVRRFVKS